jgi:hypothetical protein
MDGLLTGGSVIPGLDGGGNMSPTDIAAHNARIRAGTVNPQGATSMVNLVEKLQGVSDKIADTTFLLETDAISKNTAQRELNALEKQFRVLERQGNALSINGISISI